MEIQTSITDKTDELRKEMESTKQSCKATRDNLQAQVFDLQARQQDGQTGLAEAIKAQNENEEQSRLKNTQMTALTSDWERMKGQCKLNIESFEDEICGCRKLRTELVKMSGAAGDPIQDCAVSSWLPGECSATCDGGTQRLTRRILGYAVNGGVACPALELMRDCNQEECPVNCEVSTWEDWSSCSSKCGGGVMQRIRQVEVQPKHGGEPCGAASEEQSCGLEACDKDCSLSEWGGWSECSHQCNGGLMARRREVQKEAIGLGHCPGPKTEPRLQYKRCNVASCKLKEGAKTLTCKSKIDLMLVLDGSGSTDAEGFEAIKEGASLLLKAFKSDDQLTQVGVVLFSGPTDVSKYNECTKGKVGAEDCGIQRVSELSPDAEVVAGKVAALPHPGGSTLTSTALMTALNALSAGRRSAQSVVMVITDGRPNSPQMTEQASTLVRQKARLMWVPVTKFAPTHFYSQWSSKPVNQNVIAVSSFDRLKEPGTISKLVSDICQEVE